MAKEVCMSELATTVYRIIGIEGIQSGMRVRRGAPFDGDCRDFSRDVPELL